MPSFRMLLRQLLRRPVPLVLTLMQLAMCAVVLALTFVVLQTRQVAPRFADMFEVVAGSRSADGQALSDYALFRSSDLEALRRASPDAVMLAIKEEVYEAVLVTQAHRYRLLGGQRTTSSMAEVLKLSLPAGRFLDETRTAGSANANVLILSEVIARNIWSGQPIQGLIGQMVQLQYGESGLTPYTIIGISESPRTPASPLGAFYLSGGNRRVSTLVVRAKPGRRAEAQAQVSAAINSLYRSDPQWLANQGATYVRIVTPAQAGGDTLLDVASQAVTAVALAACLLGLFASFFISSVERLRETAMRRALGASATWITRAYLTEVAFIAAVGSSLGLGLSCLLVPWFTALLTGQPSTWPLGQALGVLAGVVALSTLSAVFPAIRATRMPVIDGLKRGV